MRNNISKTTIANFATVQNEGLREEMRKIDYYNLDAVINVIPCKIFRRGLLWRMNVGGSIWIIILR